MFRRKNRRVTTSSNAAIRRPLLFLEQLERRDLLAATINSLVVPSIGQKGDVIAMSADASSDQSGATLTYDWNFGDGTSQSGANLTDVTHAYALPSPSGSPYDLSVLVSDGTSQTATADSPIEIDDVPPTVDLGAAQTVHAGDAVAFNAAISDPAGPSDVASIQWDFNYDGQNFNPDSSANGETSPSFTYATPGTYIVETQVTDLSGNSSIGATAVVVKPPDVMIVDAGPDQTVAESAGMMGPSAAVSFNGSYSDAGGTVPPSGIAWDFNYTGQGFMPMTTGTLTPNWTYSGAGTYQVALQVTDGNGTSELSVMQVTVTPPNYVGPTASAGSDQTINEGGTAAFSGSYTDPDGTVSLMNVAWDFNYDGENFNAQTSGTLTPSHTFDAPGTYTVALQVTDNNNLTSLDTLTVTVNAVAPTVNLSASSTSVQPDQPVTFTASASDPGGSSDPISFAWDFDYDGQNFVPDVISSTSATWDFRQAGTFVVAVQATDSAGVSSIAADTIAVTPSSSLVALAWPDQAVDVGETVSFNGSYMEFNSAATVNSSSAAWDFNYSGQSFQSDPSAAGALNPTHIFTAPGIYVVAFQLTDSAGAVSTDTLYVSVTDPPPTVSAGQDQTVAEGTPLTLEGTATDALGSSSNFTSIQWDFNYDGSTFNADPSASGTFTPTYTYAAPGTYEAALQVTDQFGVSSLSTSIVTVTDVAPTATVANSGGTEGSPVTFTVSNVSDIAPNDTLTYLADWNGNGQFEMIPPDELITGSDSVSFTHAYDVAGTYNAVIEVIDGSGGTTDYTTAVNVTAAAITDTFGVVGVSLADIGPGVPFQFSNVSDPSYTETTDGFTYYVSVNGGAYVGSSSPMFYLPNYAPGISYTVSGYVQNQEGATSAVTTVQGTTVGTGVWVENDGDGYLQIGGSQTVIQPGGYAEVGDGMTMTLLTSGATYQIYTNGDASLVNAASGVTGVNLLLSTDYPGPGVNDGDVGTIDLPAASTLTLMDRGDLGSIVGADTTDELTGVTAGSLAFANLTGSITGLDSIQSIQASGWLGTSAAEQVAVWEGVGSLAVYGIGATVQTDLFQNPGDAPLSGLVGVGGITAALFAGNVSNFAVQGATNKLVIGMLSGDLDLEGAVKDGLVFLQELEVTSKIETNRFFPGSIDPYINQLVIGNGGQSTTQTLKRIGIGNLLVLGSLTVNGDFTPISEYRVAVGGNFTVHGNVLAREADRFEEITRWAVGGDFQVDGSFTVANGGLDLAVLGTAVIQKGFLIPTKRAYVDQIHVNGDLRADIQAPNSDIDSIRVEGNFQPSRVVPNGDLILANSIGDITAKNIGQGTFAGPFSIVSSTSIGNIHATAGDIDVKIVCGQGLGDGGKIASVVADPVKNAMGQVVSGGTVRRDVFAVQGDIDLVKGYRIYGYILALAQRDNGQKTNFQGDIGTVQADVRLPSLIRAENGLGTVILTGKQEKMPNVPNDTKIVAAGSECGNGTPIEINYQEDAFLGEVLLTYTPGRFPSFKASDVADSERPHFQNDDGLFQI
ncbi:MAG TPA: PKD domain-containing protein, partial [Gemmataceae bacterium]|nr:PKD domain-containing protein [Gemmataceae bacterium]